MIFLYFFNHLKLPARFANIYPLNIRNVRTLRREYISPKHHKIDVLTYCGKTKRHFNVQICEHLGISHLLGKKVKIYNKKLKAIQEHLLCCNYSPSFEYFFILTKGSSDFQLKIMESLLITHDKPILNKVVSSVPLELF